MHNSPFSNDRYETPGGRERVMHRLMLRSRAYYIARFIWIVLRYWTTARAGRFDSRTWHEASFRVFRIVEDCGGRFTISGLDNIRKPDGPVVFVANHMSTMETLILPGMIYPFKEPVYVVKDQLRSVPLFGAYVQDCIAVSRKSPSEDFKQVMAQGSEKIAQGFSVIIFPQATRILQFDPSKFNTLGIKLARKNNVPVIPLALKTDFWGSGNVLKDFGPMDPHKHIYLEYGEPFHVSGNGKAEHEQVLRFVQDRLSRWQKM